MGKPEQSVRFLEKQPFGIQGEFGPLPPFCMEKREAAETSGLEGVLFTSSRTPQYHVPPGI